MSAWWHWAIALRDNVRTYRDVNVNKLGTEAISEIAKGTIEAMGNQIVRLSEDIAKTMVRFGFPPPWDEPWKNRDPKK